MQCPEEPVTPPNAGYTWQRGLDVKFGLAIELIMNLRNSDVKYFFYRKTELKWQA